MVGTKKRSRMVVVFQSRLGPGTVSEPDEQELTRPLYSRVSIPSWSGHRLRAGLPVKILSSFDCVSIPSWSGHRLRAGWRTVSLIVSWSCFNPVLVRAPSPRRVPELEGSHGKGFNPVLVRAPSPSRRVAIGIAARLGVSIPSWSGHRLRGACCGSLPLHLRFQSRLGPGTVSEWK